MRKTISATSLSTYLGCGQRWAFKYNYDHTLPHVSVPGNAAMLAGTGFHACIEYAINRCLRGEQVSVDEAVAHGLSIAAQEFALRPLAYDFLGDLSPDGELDGILTRIKRAATWYLENEFERLRPVQAERKFAIPIPGTDGWLLIGKIDCLEEDDTVRDFKLSGSKQPPAQDIATRSEQLSIYALARYLETGSPPPSVELDYCRDGGPRIGCIVRQGTRSEKDCIRTLTRVQRVVSCIEKGVFSPASHEGIECNGKRCDYYGVCPFGGGPVG
jgi:RecB family exonuclease